MVYNTPLRCLFLVEIMKQKNDLSVLDHHPKRVISQIRDLALDLSKVDYSRNINELTQARKVSMSAIWRCLEDGELIISDVHHEENGTYAKLRDVIAGVQIELDVLMENGRLLILWAEEIEEG